MNEIDTYIQQLQADDEATRLSAVDALRELGNPSAIEPLIHALEDDSPEVRRAVIFALRQFPDDDRIIVPLVGMLKDLNISVRRRASAWVMSRGLDARLIDPMIALLADTSNRIPVREFAAMNLGMHKDRRALPALNDALAEGIPELRRRVTQSLSGLPDESSVPLLIPVLDDESAVTQKVAAKVLSLIGTKEALDAVDSWRKRK